MDINETMQREGPEGVRRRHDNARQYKPNGHGAAPNELGSICAADFEGMLVPKREWAVEGAIPQGSVTLLSGNGGLGKSVLALMLGMSHTTQTDWLGLRTMPGPFLYVGAEDDDDEIQRRLDYMRSTCAYPWKQFHNFHSKSLVGKDALLAVAERGLIKPTPLLQKIEARIGEIGAISCAIDTAADVFGGDEINRQQVRQFISLLRGVCLRQRTTILLLSHPSVAGMASGSGLSGSTSWHNSVRSRMYFEGVQGDDDARVLKFMKLNYGPKGKPMNLRWQNGLFVLDKKSARMPAEVDAMFLRMLDAYTQQKRNVTANKGTTYAPKVFTDDASCKGFSSGDMKAAMDRLLERKEIVVTEFGPPSHLRTRLERACST